LLRKPPAPPPPTARFGHRIPFQFDLERRGAMRTAARSDFGPAVCGARFASLFSSHDRMNEGGAAESDDRVRLVRSAAAGIVKVELLAKLI
jgi:hypothetical protein